MEVMSLISIQERNLLKNHKLLNRVVRGLSGSFIVTLQQLPDYGYVIAVSGGRDNPHFSNDDFQGRKVLTLLWLEKKELPICPYIRSHWSSISISLPEIYLLVPNMTLTELQIFLRCLLCPNQEPLSVPGFHATLLRVSRVLGTDLGLAHFFEDALEEDSLTTVIPSKKYKSRCDSD